MTNNDYIAEYVKEKYPNILGIDFVLWKTGKSIIKMGNCIAEALNNVNKEDLKKYLDEQKSEEKEYVECDGNED